MSYDNNPGNIGRGDVAGFNPYHFKGTIDDFKFWNRSLSAQEAIGLCSVSPSFTGLKQSYCSNEQPSQLVGTPSGGTFSGPGVNGNTFNPASAGEGTHQITYSIQTVTGAPVTSTQTTVVKLVKRAVFDRVICKGESVTYAGQTFSASGQYQIITTASNGCDSLIYLNLLVKDPSNTVIEASICQGQTYSYNGQNYSQAGEYVVSSQGAPACEKTILKLTVKPNKTAVFERVICEGESVSYGGKTFNTNGLHEVTIPASNGCDSLIRVYLTVTPASSSTIVRKICAGESVSFGGQSYNQTGIYLLQLPGTAPCHKTYLDLTVLPNNSAEYRRTICAGQSVTYGGETFNSNGVFIIETEAANGCDSTITLYLTVINGETSYVDAEICAGESYTLPNGNQVNQAGEYPVWVQGDNSNCGSTIITRLKVNPVYNKTINASINQGETYQLPDGSFVSIAGEYKSNLKTIAKCDSIITTKLSVVSPPPAGGCYAVLVKGFKQGNMKNGTPVPAIRSNPAKALFAPEPVVNGVVNFVSLGFGGEITLAFEGPVANGPGNDIRIHEATWNKRTCRNYPEEAEIFASQNACDWIYIGKVCTNGGDLDLGPLSWAQYIKVKDITNKSFSGFPGSADAFDVNAIECLNGPGTIADDGLIAGSIQDVVDYLPGTMKNGGQLPPARKVPAQATGLPGGAGVNFVSLGFGGTFIGRFDYVVFNFPGADLKVLETSYGNPSCANYPEYAHFYGSKDGNSWFDLGVDCQDADIDLGLADWIQYIKVVDESLILSGKFNGAADGYDLDGVATIQPCENSKIELDFSDNVNEADEAYVLSVYPNPVVDQFNVMLEGLENDQAVTVQLTDASGRLVFEKQFSTRGKILSETISAENLPHGIYHLAIRTQGSVWIEKLVK
ncbi:MAG: T9SS type A sorting domain-containing protein, partial [Bacteroidia bacterium]|nr:T9SS type A sorting domain-containing protein [Bacteroidia bacterium]